MKQATVADFRQALDALFEAAVKNGNSYAEVRCGDLHDTVNRGGRRHSTCSGVMWAETAKGDCKVLETPVGGVSTRLAIRYRVPRPPSYSGL